MSYVTFFYHDGPAEQFFCEEGQGVGTLKQLKWYDVQPATQGEIIMEHMRRFFT